MRYATPTRSAHRAIPAGSLALLVRHPGPIGQHRYHPGVRTRPHRHVRRNPHQTAHLLTRGLAALIVAGIFVMLAVLIVADERHPTTSAGHTTAEIDRLLASRAVDPAPLSETEVFPAGSASYALGKTGLTADCTVAVTGTLRSTLQRYGCTQAVRAALTVPYADYRITAGVLNLPDTAAATALGTQIREQVVTADGGFSGMSGEEPGPGTPIVWRTRGHYLMYCVITGPNGELLPADDPRVQQITHDLVDVHLAETVLPRRAT
ncbi:hypothetical protein [Actinoplanes sp. GCM10030250]|uniref:hypothetical protein n=1 Tax=Actinoplanes sp. GCM10030250 TaxID=3273376 RepID=UPI0036078501